MLKKVFYGLLIVALLLLAAGIALYYWFGSGGLQKYTLEHYGKDIIQSQDLYDIILDGLGFEEEKHVLILFLNNTELRPGGGFIGSYATVSTQNGVPRLLKVEGTEILDNYAASYIDTVPPAPVKEYLSVDKWYFRDSNWSPDFSESAKKSLELYTSEKGIMAKEIDYVVGITPTVVREILKITGPVKINGTEYNADNFIDKLQWEVEYGYAKSGASFAERKKTLQELTKTAFINFGRDFLKYNKEFVDLAKEMLREKQIIIYALDPEMQQRIVSGGWAGEMKNTDGDFVLWADANLGSLKTDLALERELSYEISPTSGGKYLAKVSMKYMHRGEFDWRTTRYRTYARVFVPQGSKLIKTVGAMKKEKSNEPATIDWGEEGGKQWFGAFIAIEPGKTGELSFEYYLAPEIAKIIENNKYNLVVQKQIGTEAHKLTLNLDFGKKISKAVPSEESAEFGDTKYKISGDLRVDSWFDVEME